MTAVQFGWMVPEAAIDGSNKQQFLDQLYRHLDIVSEHYDSIWIGDHFVPTDMRPPTSPDSLECWTTVSFLAAAYPRLSLGTFVLSQSYRNPALLAKMAATLCWLAPGRFIFGIGAGWFEPEYRAYGYPIPPLATRMGQLDEALTIVRRMWTEDSVTFEGQHYHVREACLSPKPDPLPPIMIGTSGERLGLRLVAKHAGWYHLPFGTREEYQHKLDVLRGHCVAVGTDFDRIVRAWGSVCTAIAPTEAEAGRIAAGSLYCDPVSSRLVGTPDAIAKEVQAWIDLGITQFQLQFADFPRLDGLRLFTSEVLPRF